MSSSNQSASLPAFLLPGFPGLEDSHIWISIPISSMCFVAIAGNGTILFIIKTDQALHEPMYYFLSMLALSGLGLSATTLPTMWSVLWFNHRGIGFNACLVQMYFIHTFSIVESGILLSMAFDRLVAIRNPLRYTSTLTNEAVIKMGTGVAVRAAFLVLPAPILLQRLRYGRVSALSYSSCLHQDILKTVRSDKRTSSFYGLTVVISSMGLDSVLLLFSYLLILKTVLSIASKAERLRALNTCIAHICAVLTFYVPMIGLSMIHRYGEKAPPVVHSLMAHVYLLVPPLMNPIVYSVKTKEIRRRLVRRFRKGKESAGAN